MLNKLRSDRRLASWLKNDRILDARHFAGKSRLPQITAADNMKITRFRILLPAMRRLETDKEFINAVVNWFSSQALC